MFKGVGRIYFIKSYQDQCGIENESNGLLSLKCESDNF